MNCHNLVIVQLDLWEHLCDAFWDVEHWSYLANTTSGYILLLRTLNGSKAIRYLFIG